MAGETERYWAAFEAETGERVVTRAMGQWYEDPAASDGRWGLLILTDRSFRFRHEPGESWLAGLFRNQTRSSGTKGPIEIVVPREALISLEEPRRGFLHRVFGPSFPRFQLSWEIRPGDGARDAGTGLFSIDDSRGFLAALRKVLPAKGDTG